MNWYYVFSRGQLAGLAGVSLADNPYTHHRCASVWERGWLSQRDKMMKDRRTNRIWLASQKPHE